MSADSFLYTTAVYLVTASMLTFAMGAVLALAMGAMLAALAALHHFLITNSCGIDLSPPLGDPITL
jgi:hypothetical protein